MTISREFLRLLGGEVSLESEEGKGSNFTIFLPINYDDAVIEGSADTVDLKSIERKSESGNKSLEEIQNIIQSVKVNGSDRADSKAKSSKKADDDRDKISESDKSILIIEDDNSFANILTDVIRENDYKILKADEGKEGLEMAMKYQPNGIILDIQLPDIDGLKILDHLKYNLKTRHIPVHVMSSDQENIKSLKKGAIGFNAKPVSRDDINTALTKLKRFQGEGMKHILVVEDSKMSREAIKKTLDNKSVKLTTVEKAEDALKQLKKEKFDCIILDLSLPGISGFDFLKEMKNIEKAVDTPVIVYTGKELSKKEVDELSKEAESIVIKGASSPERLLDEVSLFLHSMEGQLSSKQKNIINKMHDLDKVFQGKKVLLVDDDMRNTYALSKTLSDTGLDVVIADNGKTALEKMKEEKVDLVLMDIMMPVMDGYEAMGKIRKDKKYDDIPIIALTAKAMAEDKEKTLQAGANDYLTKPVNVEKLLNIMRVWLHN